MTIEPFRIAVPDEDIADLRARLARTRWPDAIPGSGWDYGTDLAFLKDLVARWKDRYDWRAHEAELNAFAHFRAGVESFGLHFVHERGNGPRPVPLLLSHACFSNAYEFHSVIRQLADPAAFGGDPADAFDVVAWDMPGFGFSDQPQTPGYNIERLAEYALGLMRVLGYERFGAAGGSWGGMVASRLAYAHPNALLGIFLTQASPYASLPSDLADFTAAEQEYVERNKAWGPDEGGYLAIQSTRPQSLAYGLVDSPAGQAGWMVEKLRRWSDCGGVLGSTFTLDEVLTNLSIYWYTGTINSAQRLYYEWRHGDWAPEPGRTIFVPTGILALPGGIPPEAAPRDLIERMYNVTHYTMSPRGGHFPALEIPEIFVDELRAFYRPLRGELSLEATAAGSAR